ncbi:hypothetical protein BJ742DRAFT_891549 [Cladochytrium replicatum]|nr:hypothetical protein BJ742DRAFT_891549 [Cladochytrium replicatum]
MMELNFWDLSYLNNALVEKCARQTSLTQVPAAGSKIAVVVIARKGDLASVKGSAGKAKEIWNDVQGQLKVVVNTGARGRFTSRRQAERERGQMNLFGLIGLIQLLQPAMNRNGRLVYVISQLGRMMISGMGFYCMSKAALWTLSDGFSALSQKMDQHLSRRAQVGAGKDGGNFPDLAQSNESDNRSKQKTRTSHKHPLLEHPRPIPPVLVGVHEYQSDIHCSTHIPVPPSMASRAVQKLPWLVVAWIATVVV